MDRRTTSQPLPIAGKLTTTKTIACDWAYAIRGIVHNSCNLELVISGGETDLDKRDFIATILYITLIHAY